MIIGFPKRTLLALPRAVQRVVKAERLAAPKPRFGLFSAFGQMMERQADLIIRGMGS